MILKIEQSKYYGHQNKTKDLFRKKYRSLKLKWMENVKLGDDIVDGWMNDDRTQYLLKLPEENEFKRFTGNSLGMIEFLKNHGAIEVSGNEKGVHKNYDDTMGFMTMEDRFGRCVGSDLYSHYRTEEMLKDMSDDWSVNWGTNNFNLRKDVKMIETVKPKRRIIRRIRND